MSDLLNPGNTAESWSDWAKGMHLHQGEGISLFGLSPIQERCSINRSTPEEINTTTTTSSWEETKLTVKFKSRQFVSPGYSPDLMQKVIARVSLLKQLKDIDAILDAMNIQSTKSGTATATWDNINEVKRQLKMDYLRELQNSMHFSDSDSDDYEDMVGHGELGVSGYSESTRITCPTAPSNISSCPSLSTINGSFTSLHGHMIASDVETSIHDKLCSSPPLYHQSAPRGLYSQKPKAYFPTLARPGDLDIQELAAVETEKKLADILKYLASEGAWSPVKHKKKSAAPPDSVHENSSLDLTPKAPLASTSDLNDSGSVASSLHGVTLPGNNNSSFHSDSQSVLVDDYDIKSLDNSAGTSDSNSRSKYSEYLNVSAAVQPTRTHHHMHHGTTTGSSSSSSASHLTKPGRKGSACDIEPLNRMVRRMNMADRMPCDGKEDTPQIGGKRFSGIRSLSHSDTDLKRPLSSCNTRHSDSDITKCHQMTVEAEVHSLPDSSTLRVKSGQVNSSPDISAESQQCQESHQPSLHSKAVREGGILHNKHLSTKEYLIARCSMSSFPTAMDTPPVPEMMPMGGPPRGWRKKPQRTKPENQQQQQQPFQPRLFIKGAAVPSSALQAKLLVGDSCAQPTSGMPQFHHLHGAATATKPSYNKTAANSKKHHISRGSLESPSESTESSESQRSIIVERPIHHQSMFVDIGSCDTDCDDLHNFYVKDVPVPLYRSGRSSMDRSSHTSRGVPPPSQRNMSMDSDATAFMQAPMMCVNRRSRPITVAAGDSKREKKVWKKFKSFKKQLSRIAVNSELQNNGELRTLAIV